MFKGETSLEISRKMGRQRSRRGTSRRMHDRQAKHWTWHTAQHQGALFPQTAMSGLTLELGSAATLRM